MRSHSAIHSAPGHMELQLPPLPREVAHHRRLADECPEDEPPIIDTFKLFSVAENGADYPDSALAGSSNSLNDTAATLYDTFSQADVWTPPTRLEARSPQNFRSNAFSWNANGIPNRQDFAPSLQNGYVYGRETSVRSSVRSIPST